ncbi:MAG: DUF1592 domain-containing protein [Myxococcota bacterium]
MMIVQATCGLLVGCYSGIPGGEPMGVSGAAPAGDDEAEDDGDDGDGERPPRAAQADPWQRAELRRLTASQYAATVAALLGEGAQPLEGVPNDLVSELYATVGASVVSTSALAVEQYEDLALRLTQASFADPSTRLQIVGCDPSEAACRDGFVTALGRRAWRRPLTAEERQRYQALFDSMLAVHGDPWTAARFVTAALMSSPHFLYLVELGEPDPAQPSRRRYTSVEMASRLAYFLWDGPPDEALLALAEEGALTHAGTVADQAWRMVEDERSRAAVARFFAEHLGLDATATLVKDPELFPAASVALFADMRGEVERLVEDVVFARQGSLHDLLTTRDTFVTPQLAALYGAAADGNPDAEGFVRVTLPPESARTGYLGTAAFLAMTGRVTRTSPTLRGAFVQQRLLCNELPPPPPEVDADLPEPTDPGPPRTMREILAEHRANPACAGCHDLVDPLGLSLEHFDGVGAYREDDRGLALDVSGDLDGVSFDGLGGLVETLADNPRLSECMARQMYRYALGHVETLDERTEVIADVAARTPQDSHTLLEMMVAIATSRGFRYRGTED